MTCSGSRSGASPASPSGAAPSGLATSLSESAGGLVESVRSFVEDVRVAMAEREREIHAAFADGVLYEDEFADLRDDDTDSQEGVR